MIVVKLADLSDIGTETTLDDVLEVDFLDNLNEVGSFSVTVTNNNPQLADIVTPNTLANLYVDGTLAFTGVFEWSEATYASRDEDHGLVTIWHGSGALALFDRAVVNPALALLSHPIEEDRGFNALSAIYDESDMVAATAICTVLDAQTGSWPVPWDPDFADPGADVLGPSTGSTSTASTGFQIIRQPVTIPEGLAQLQILADNFADFYVAGAPFASPGQELTTQMTGFTSMTTRTEFFTAGLYSFAARLVNVGLPPSNVDDPTGLAWTLVATDASGNLGAVIASSSAAFALIHEYPSEMPGMTPGTIGLQCIGEAQGGTALAGPGSRADGDPLAAINLITTNFDDDNDSNSDAWAIIPDYATKILTTLTQVWRELATYVDFWMTPGTLDFQMVATGNRGTVKVIDFHRPTAGPGTGNILEWTAKSEGAKSNALTIRSNVGWSDRESVAGIASHGRIEAGVSYGANSSLEEVNRTADADLADFARERTQHTIEIAPLGGDVPFDDFTVGDTVTLEGDPHRVLGLGASWAEKEETRYTIVLNDGVVLDMMERVGQWLTKNVLGAINGRSQRAQPFVPVYVPRARPLPAAAVFTETFTGSDGDLGTTVTDLEWTASSGEVPLVVSNECTLGPGGAESGVARCDITLATQNQWAEFDMTGFDINDQIYFHVREDTAGGADLNSDEKLFMSVFYGGGGVFDVELGDWFVGFANVDVSPVGLLATTATWRIEVTGNTMSAYVDGDLLGTADCSASNAAGTHIGFSAYGGSSSPTFTEVRFGDL